MPELATIAISLGLVAKKAAVFLKVKAWPYLKQHYGEILKAVGEGIAKDGAMKQMKNAQQDADNMPDDVDACVQACPFVRDAALHSIKEASGPIASTAMGIADVTVEWIKGVEEAKPAAKARLDTYAAIYDEDAAVSAALNDSTVRWAISPKIMKDIFVGQYKAEELVREYIRQQQQ